MTHLFDRYSCRFFLGGVLLAAIPPAALAEETIRVEAASGRRFTGTLDQRTGPQQLWLRFGSGGAVLYRPIDWQRVVAVESDGRRVAGAEFRQDLLAKGKLDAGPAAKNPPRVEELPGPRQETQPTPSSPIRSASTISTPISQPKVASLYLEPTLANWDADVESDGLIVRVMPLDAQGTIVPVHGTLTIDLTAEGRAQHWLSEPFIPLARWTRTLEPGDFGSQGALIRLPFQARHPEFDLDLRDFGVVHARLAVPGQGAFEQSTDMVRIRPASSMRDRLQLLQGTRFFPEERTGRGKFIAPNAAP